MRVTLSYTRDGHLKIRTHFILGAGISSISAARLTLDPAMTGLLGIIGGVSTVVPDLDLLFAVTDNRAHRSRFSHSIGASLFIAAVMLMIFLIVANYFEFAIIDWWVIPILASLFLSAFSHPAIDSLTRAGTILFWPFSNRKFSGRFKYNDLVANSAFVILGLVLIIAALTTV